MKSYGHIIYTRTGPGYDGTGRPMPRNQGYAIYSVTDGLFQKLAGNESFLDGVAVKIKNRQFITEQQIESYAYMVSPNGQVKALGKTTARTYAEAEAAERDGVDTRADHTLELLVGEPDRNPCRLMGSPFFTAYQKPISYYYQQREPLAPEAPVASETIADGSLTAETISRFLQADSQRVQDVRNCVAWLLQEYDKPVQERHALVIEAPEQTVRMWIACITSGLPRAAAAEVSFCTSLNLRANKIFIRVNKGTLNFEKNIDLTNPNQISVPLFMINGVTDRSLMTNDPMAVTLEMLRTQSVPAAALDPAVRQSAFVTAIGASYDQLETFSGYAEGMKDIHMGTELCKLFDACDLGSTPRKWTYEKLSEAIDVLLPHLLPTSTLTRFFVYELITNKNYEKQYARADLSGKLSLLEKLDRLDRLSGASGTAVHDIMVRRLETALSSGKHFDREDAATIKAILDTEGGKKVLKDLAKGPLRDVVDMSNVWSSEYASYVMSLFNDVLYTSINSDAVRQVIRVAMQDPAVFDRMFAALGPARILERVPMMEGTRYGRKWFTALMEKNVEVDALKSALLDLHLPNEDSLLNEIYTLGAGAIKDPVKQVHELKKLLHTMEPAAKLQLLMEIDTKLPMTPEALNLAKLLYAESYADSDRLENSRALLAMTALWSSMGSLQSIWHKYQKDLGCVHLEDKRITHRSGIGEKIFSRLTKSGDMTSVAIAMELASLLNDQSWAEAYVDYIAEDCRKLGGGNALAELCAIEAHVRKKASLPREAEGVLSSNGFLVVSFCVNKVSEALSKFNMNSKKNGLLKKAYSINRPAETVMTEILEKAAAEYGASHKNPLDRLTSLFSRKSDKD